MDPHRKRQAFHPQEDLYGEAFVTDVTAGVEVFAALARHVILRLAAPECIAADATFNQSWLLSILPVLIGQIFFAALACVFRSKARKMQAIRAFWQFANFTMLVRHVVSILRRLS